MDSQKYWFLQIWCQGQKNDIGIEIQFQKIFFEQSSLSLRVLDSLLYLSQVKKWVKQFFEICVLNKMSFWVLQNLHSTHTVYR